MRNLGTFSRIHFFNDFLNDPNFFLISSNTDGYQQVIQMDINKYYRWISTSNTDGYQQVIQPDSNK
jgi:hypothetical protein